MQLLLKNDAKPSLHQPVRYQIVYVCPSWRSNFLSFEGLSTDYVTVGPIRNRMKFFPRCYFRYLTFFLVCINIKFIKSVASGWTSLYCWTSIKRPPAGTGKWPLNRGSSHVSILFSRNITLFTRDWRSISCHMRPRTVFCVFPSSNLKKKSIKPS